MIIDWMDCRGWTPRWLYGNEGQRDDMWQCATSAQCVLEVKNKKLFSTSKPEPPN